MNTVTQFSMTSVRMLSVARVSGPVTSQNYKLLLKCQGLISSVEVDKNKNAIEYRESTRRPGGQERTERKKEMERKRDR